jgi:hypothetical protein
MTSPPHQGIQGGRKNEKIDSLNSGRTIMQILECARHHTYDRTMENGRFYTNEELKYMCRLASY